MRSCAVCCKDGSCSCTISTCRVELCMCNLGLISSLVNISCLPGYVLVLYFFFFDRMVDEDLDEQRLQWFFFAQDTPEALEVFALTRPTPQHDRHLRFRHIDALIEHPGRDDHTVVPLLESVENVLAFSDPCFMGNHRNEILP